ncbi:MAG: hypothetical protein WC356_07000 [Candidatus Micrarchaeia archaeon]
MKNQKLKTALIISTIAISSIFGQQKGETNVFQKQKPIEEKIKTKREFKSDELKSIFMDLKDITPEKEEPKKEEPKKTPKKEKPKKELKKIEDPETYEDLERWKRKIGKIEYV